MQHYKSMYNLKIFSKKIIQIFLICLLFCENAFAIYDGPRRIYNDDNSMCDVGKIETNPYKIDQKDLHWNASVPQCAGFMGGVGASLLVTLNLAMLACKPYELSNFSWPQILEEKAQDNYTRGTVGPMINSAMYAALTMTGTRCVWRTNESSLQSAYATSICASPPPANAHAP